MSFLKAEWRKLVMVNYEVNPEVLKPNSLMLLEGSEISVENKTVIL